MFLHHVLQKRQQDLRERETPLTWKMKESSASRNPHLVTWTELPPCRLMLFSKEFFLLLRKSRVIIKGNPRIVVLLRLIDI